MKLSKLFPIIGIAILIFILSQLDFVKIITVLSAINPWYLAASFCSIIPIILLVNFEWQLVLKKHNIHVSFAYSLKNIFIGYFYGFITPGAIGGYTRAYYLKEESKEPLQKCLVNIVLFNTTDYLALLTLGVIGGFALGALIPSILPVIVVLFIVILILMIVLLRKDTGRILFRKLFESKLLSSFKEKWVPHLDTLYDELPKTRDLAPPFLISISGWILWFSELYIISDIFSIHIPYLSFIAIVAVANVLASLPISIYGLGTREAALIGLFSLFGVAAENVLSLSLFWFVLSWLIPSIIGAGITILESRRNKSSIQKTIEKE